MRTVLKRAISHQRRWRSAAADASPRPSPFVSLEEVPLDSNHATAAAFDADPSPLKVNLGRGVYKDDKGKSWTLPSVRMAEEEISKTDFGHEYLPFSGWPTFVKRTAEFAWGGDYALLAEGRIATVQTISGTGALRVAAELLGGLMRAAGWEQPEVYVPDPTYVNHYRIHTVNGFHVRHYRYYDPTAQDVAEEAMLADLREARPGSFVLLHACAHNPTGTDPSPALWAKLAEVFVERRHIAFFDSAYQGFASGDPDRDAAAYRLFAARGVRCVLAQSYAKNFGLYGQRVGALHVTCNSPAETKLVLSNLNQIIRPMYSNPPAYGARIVGTVLSTPRLLEQWRVDVKTMADRISGMRRALVAELASLGSRRSWDHIQRQIGMFAYSGLTREEVERLRALHVYMNFDGRMSISGINSSNVRYLADAMHKATSI